MGRASPAVRPGRASAASPDPDAATAEIARLEGLDLAALRVAFRNRTGRIAPARIARTLLVRVLAYRIQAELFGDLRPETRRMLDAITVAAGSASSRPGDRTTPAVPVRDAPKRGTVLVREWRGRMQHVMVLDQGYAWNGSAYASLSAVALAITGTKWNGRRFFGLDRPEGEKPVTATDQRGIERGRDPEQNRNKSTARPDSSGTTFVRTPGPRRSDRSTAAAGPNMQSSTGPTSASSARWIRPIVGAEPVRSELLMPAGATP